MWYVELFVLLYTVLCVVFAVRDQHLAMLSPPSIPSLDPRLSSSDPLGVAPSVKYPPSPAEPRSGNYITHE